MRFSRFKWISFTVTSATPAVFTSTAHELTEGDTIWLETTGALYTGLTEDTTYYVVRNGITADTFQIATSKNGTPINTSGSQSGAHTWIKTNRAKLSPNIESCK